MRIFFTGLVLAGFLVPSATLYHKTQVLELPLLPVEATDNWSFQLRFNHGSEPTSTEAPSELLIPMPSRRTEQRFQVNHLHWRAERADVVGRNGSDFLRLVPRRQAKPGTSIALLSGHLVAQAARPEVPPLGPSAETDAAPYLDWKTFVSEEDREALEALRVLLHGMPVVREGEARDRPSALEIVKRYFYFIYEEISPHRQGETLSQAISRRRGSSFVRAKLLVMLARQQGVPARIAWGAYLDDRTAKSSLPLRFAVEIKDGAGWIPVDPNRGTWGTWDSSFWVIARDIMAQGALFDSARINVDLRVQARRVVTGQGKENYSDVLRGHAFYRMFSLLSLPIQQQSYFALLLLLPISSLVLASLRVVVGIPSFGIFTPVLLGLFFEEASLAVGLAFFGIVVLVGALGRALLDRLRLLAVPRLAIIMSLIILGMLLFAVQNQALGWVAPEQLSFFPLVILTVFIERFSVTYAEEGVFNTARDLAGTLVIALATFGVLSASELKLFLLTHPETILACMSALLLLGAYRGYRLSELRRFAALGGAPSGPSGSVGTTTGRSGTVASPPPGSVAAASEDLADGPVNVDGNADDEDAAIEPGGKA